jgi:outer membrane lipoprotein-sorting protein
MKTIRIGVYTLLAVVLLIVAGCSNAKPPKEAIVAALTKMKDVKSLSFKGSFVIDDFSIPKSVGADSNNAAAAAAIAGFMKGATINVHGVMQSDPEQAEITLDISLGSADMKFNLSIPIVVTKEKIWIKVPQIPGLPIPEAVAGKFVEIDLKKLAEENGAAVPDTATTQKLAQDLLKTLFDNFDEKAYFSEPKAEEVKGLPEGYKEDQFVRFAINGQNFDQAVTSIIDKVVPQMIDLLLNNEEYMKTLQIKKEDLETAKKELAGKEKGEIQTAIEDIKKNLKVNEFSVTGGIQDGYLTYQDVRMNLDFVDGADTAKFVAHLTMSYSNINEAVKFEYGLPKDAVPLEQLQQMLGMPDRSGM